MRPLTALVLATLFACLVLTIRYPVPLLQVTSSSMQPTLSSGDLALSLPPSLVGGISEGSIIVYREEGAWTTHRVVETDGTSAVTAGDANPFTDQQAGSAPVSTDIVSGVIPTVAGRPLAVSADWLPASPWVVGFVGGLLVVVGSSGQRTPSRAIRSGTIVVLTGTIAVLAWMLGGSVATHDGGTVGNTGIVPTVAITQSPSTASIVYPGHSVEVAADSIRLMPGWAPGWLLEVTASIHPYLSVATTALVSACLVGLVSIGMYRQLPPA